MATTSAITGRIVLPDNVAPTDAVVRFVLSGFDTDQTDTDVIAPYERTVTLESDGDLPPGVVLWRNANGIRSTRYQVFITVTVIDPFGNMTRRAERSLGFIQIGTASSYDIADLFDQSAGPFEAGAVVYPTLAAAVAAALAGADTATTQAGIATTQAGIATDAANAAAIAGITVLSNVWGSSTAYTATGPAGVDRVGQFVWFTPHTANTTGGPTLSINGGIARGIAARVGSLGAGRFGPGQPVLLYRESLTIWRTVLDLNAPTVTLSSPGGSGSVYTASLGGKVAPPNASLLYFVAPFTNPGPCKLALDGGAEFNILYEDGSGLAAGALRSGGRYLLWNVGAGYTVIGLRRDETKQLVDTVVSDVRRLESLRHNVITEGSRERDPIFVNGLPFGYWCASVGDEQRTIVVAGGSMIDLRFVRAGAAHPLTIYGEAGGGKLFDGVKIKTLSVGGMVRVFSPVAGTVIFDVVAGTLTEEADADDGLPAADFSFITGGQSLAVRALTEGGLHGLQLGLRHFGGWTPSIYAVQGGTGATGLLPQTGATFWWDDVNQLPGPAALTWKAALDAMPAAQPAPAFIYWCFGQQDAGWIGTTGIGGAFPVLTLSHYKAQYQNLFEWMRDQIDPIVRTPIIFSPLGGFDFGLITASQERGPAAVRWVEIDLIAEDANIHYGAPYFDIPRPFNDVHLDTNGTVMQGYRLAAAVHNLLNSGTARQGPVLHKVTSLLSGLEYRVEIDIDGGPPFFEQIGPGDFAVYASGETPLSADPLPILGTRWVTQSGRRSIILTLDAASPGATVMFPHGTCRAALRGEYVRDLSISPAGLGWGNYWPLKPFKAGPT